MSRLLGIDVGTSATKAVLTGADARVIATASAPHPSARPRPAWSEQDPRDWWASACAAVADVLKRSPGPVRALGLSGQMHGSVLLDRSAVASGGEQAEPLRPAILWNDQRTAAECDEIERLAGGRRALVRMAGNAALTGFTLPKLFWIRRHEPDLWRRAAALLLPKDYVGFRLTGVPATDVGDACGTLLFDVDRRAWSDSACRLFDIDPSILPPAYESGVMTGTVTAAAAAQTGLAEGTPVIAGSGDNQAGAIGAGVVSPGMVLATLGTSGVLYAHADRPRKDDADPAAAGRTHTMCAADGDARRPGAWCVTGCMLSAAGSLQWCRDALFPGETFDTLLAEAASAPAGSAGLVFLPYLTGERCPYPDPLARAGWIGLTSRHTRAHLVRAVLEGVTFSLAQILALFRAIGVDARAARVGGGGAKSPLWRRMLADVLGLPVAMTNTEEGPAYGAALLAGVGVGVWSGVVPACQAAVRETEVIPPGDPAPYAPAREAFDRLYADLRPAMARLADADR